MDWNVRDNERRGRLDVTIFWMVLAVVKGVRE